MHAYATISMHVYVNVWNTCSYSYLQNSQDPKRADVNEKVREWVLKRCNNKLDPAISMLEKMPSLQDELVRMEDR